MKCEYHPEAEAIGICVNCGRAVCADCKLMLANRTYCQACADRIFYEKDAVKPAGGRSGLLTAGGVLGIIGGAFGLFYALLLVSQCIFEAIDSGSSLSDDTRWTMVANGIAGTAFVLFATLELIGGIFALKKRRFKLSLFGAICGILCLPSLLFGVLATIFIALSKSEFKQPPTGLQEPMDDVMRRGLGFD
jgi:hypothetical protein